MARDIEAPVLVLHGSEDYVVPVAWGQALAQAIPGARFVVVPGAGHGLRTDVRLRGRAIEFIKDHEQTPHG